MAVLTALPQSISAWQHQQTDWQNACRPRCMSIRMAMAQGQVLLTPGWAVIWAPRLRVSSQDRHLALHARALAFRCLHNSLDLHASSIAGHS